MRPFEQAGCRPGAVPGRARALGLGLAALAVAACAPATPAAGGATGASTNLTRLSTNKQATYADLAIAVDGTYHAVFRDVNPSSKRHQLYYRASKDAGATWSEPLNLSDAERDREVGFTRLVIDGAGRVYALWWHALSREAAASNVAGAATDPGTLVYRVLDGGAWSPTVPIGKEQGTYAWFPALDAAGRVTAVWVEGLPDAGATDQASRVMQASLTGATLGARVEIRRGQAVPHQDSPSLLQYDRYEALRGYVDAAGKAHWSAMKIPAAGTASDRVLVTWDGAQETELGRMDRYGKVALVQHPPQLFVDAAGREHVAVLDLAGDKPALVDRPVGTSDAPTPIRAAQGVGGSVEGFQLSVASAGRAAAFVALREAASDKAADLYVVTFDGKQWQPPVNLTGNAARESSAVATTAPGTALASLTRYVPRFGAGAFATDGKLRVLMVNAEYTMFGDYSTNANRVSMTGASDDAFLYFAKL